MCHCVSGLHNFPGPEGSKGDRHPSSARLTPQVFLELHESHHLPLGSNCSSLLDGSSALPPSMLPGEPTQEEDAEEQEDAAGHCYLILLCEHECLHSCSCFCEL